MCNLSERGLLLRGGRREILRLITYDCEVFAYDWLVVFKDKGTGQRTRIWNDNEALKMALSEDGIYVGFNSKHYDQFIIKAIAAGFTPQEIKQSQISWTLEGSQRLTTNQRAYTGWT